MVGPSRVESGTNILDLVYIYPGGVRTGGVPPSDHRPRGHQFERWRVTRRPFCLGKTVFWPPLHRANTGQAVIWPPLYMLNLSTQKAFLMHKRIFKVIYCQWVGQWVLSHLRALWACLNESISRDGIGPRDMYRWCGLLPRETSSLYGFATLRDDGMIWPPRDPSCLGAFPEIRKKNHDLVILN